jgi:protein arginine kinase activator
MRCDACHEREAVVHLTQIADDQIAQVHLCEKCAAEKGVETGTALAKTPLGGFLAQLSVQLPAVPGGGEVRCPGCGAALADFRETGRLGCAECWTTFRAPLTDLVRRLHGAVRHTGERYAAAGTPTTAAADAAREVERLRAELREAVAAEDFERAARLRDALKARS